MFLVYHVSIVNWKPQGGDLEQALAFFFEQEAPPDGGISAADTTDQPWAPGRTVGV